MLDKIKKALLTGKQQNISELAEKYGVTTRAVRADLKALTADGLNLKVFGNNVQAVAETPAGRTGIDVGQFTNADGWYKFGACGDKHMGSKHCRLDVLNALYDLYEAEGIKHVFDTGNWIDGEARFNFSELNVYGMQAQIEFWAKKHPKRDGVITYFVGGDDHEGWYQQKLKMSIGQYAEGVARDMGRDDLRYIGYMVGEVTLKSARGSARMHVLHPGGGSAYAESYTQQKIAEAYAEGEKPHVCLIGHYHKALYGFHRGIHCLQTGTTQDQTNFMMKKRLKAVVGGWIVDMHQSPSGEINRFRPEFIPFYSRAFYKKNKRSFDINDQKRIITL